MADFALRPLAAGANRTIADQTALPAALRLSGGRDSADRRFRHRLADAAEPDRPQLAALDRTRRQPPLRRRIGCLRRHADPRRQRLRSGLPGGELYPTPMV